MFQSVNHKARRRRLCPDRAKRPERPSGRIQAGNPRDFWGLKVRTIFSITVDHGDGTRQTSRGEDGGCFWSFRLFRSHLRREYELRRKQTNPEHGVGDYSFWNFFQRYKSLASSEPKTLNSVSKIPLVEIRVSFCTRFNNIIKIKFLRFITYSTTQHRYEIIA